MGALTNDISSNFPIPPGAANVDPQTMATLQQTLAPTAGPFQVRNLAIMTGVNAGISCVMKRLRGKEDVQSSFWICSTVFVGEWPGCTKSCYKCHHFWALLCTD